MAGKKGRYSCSQSRVTCVKLKNHQGNNKRSSRELASCILGRMWDYCLEREKEIQPDYCVKIGHCLNRALWVMSSKPLLLPSPMSQESDSSLEQGLHSQLAPQPGLPTGILQAACRAGQLPGAQQAFVTADMKYQSWSILFCFEQIRRQFKVALRVSFLFTQLYFI